MSIPIPGEEGFSLVTYKGKAKTEKQWVGPVTGASYVFGGEALSALVDKRDAVMFTDKLFDVHDLAAPLQATDAEDAPVVVVQFVRHRGGSVIVEYDGHRYYVPRLAISYGPYRIDRAPKLTIPASILALSIPYGDDFETIFADIPGIDARLFARELRAINVWTIDDYHTHSPAVCKLINRLLGLSDAIARAQSKSR